MPDVFPLAAVIDLAVLLTVLEGMGLIVYRRRTGRGIPAAAFVPNLLAGLSLMLALRCAVHGAAGWVPVWLVCAGAAHLVDVGRRWRKGLAEPAEPPH
jgi:hypothetical protein